MDLTAGIHQEVIDPLDLAETFFVAEIDAVRDRVDAVRETDIVELDLVKTDIFDRFDRQQHVILLDFRHEGRRPVGTGDHDRLAGVLVCQRIFRMIRDQRVIFKGNDTSDHIQSGIMTFLNSVNIGLLIKQSVFVSGRTEFFDNIGLITDAVAFLDIDDESVDVTLCRQFKITVQIARCCPVQVQCPDFLRHDCFRTFQFRQIRIFRIPGVSAAPLIFTALMDFRHRPFVLRGRDFEAFYITFLSFITDFITVYLTIR